MPSPTPAGILMEITSSPCIVPVPWQTLHLLAITWPSPWQVGQVEVVCIWPKIVLVTRRTCPEPLHVLHLLNADAFCAPVPLQPEHGTALLTFIFFSTPLEISASDSFTLMRRLLPRFT